MTRSLFWIGLAAAALAAAWLFLSISPLPAPSEILFEAQAPWVIGNREDPFDYAGADVATIEGTANLRIDPDTKHGLLEVELRPDGAPDALLDGVIAEHSVLLRMQLEQADDIWIEVAVHGHSERGESRLPETHALYAGSGRFELSIDGVRQSTEWHGFWSYGHAIRQPDGSIRDQGLVFSPLLRNRSRFSDSSRRELTLLIYDTPESDVVILHLVFPDVPTIEG